VLRELSLMGFSNMLDYVTPQKDGYAYVDLSKLTRDQAAAIQEITTESFVSDSEDDEEEESGKVITKVKFKLADKRGSLELLGKHLKLFADRTELSGPGGGPIPIQMLSSIPRPKRNAANAWSVETYKRGTPKRKISSDSWRDPPTINFSCFLASQVTLLEGTNHPQISGQRAIAWKKIPINSTLTALLSNR